MTRRAPSSWILLSLLSVLACKGNACKGEGSASPAPPPVERWRYARMDVRQESLPARFQAPLPDLTRNDENAWGPEQPPRSYVRDLLCAGDPAMGERLSAAVDRTVTPGVDASKGLWSYANLFFTCRTNHCAWARGVVLDPKRSAAVREVMWFRLARCDDPGTVALFETREAPAHAYIAFLDNPRWGVPEGAPAVPLTPKLERAAVDVLRGPKDAPFLLDARTAALLLGATDSPRAAELLLKLHAGTADASLREDLAAAMYRQSHPQARSVFQALCAQGREPLCRSSGSAPSRTSGGPGDPEEDPAGFAQREDVPRAERIERLTGCARPREDDGGRSAACLGALATLSYEKAVEVAKTWDAESMSGDMRDTSRALTRFPTLGAFEAYLDGLGLTALPGRTASKVLAPTVEEVLAARGRATTFDVETGMFPNEHDSLLRELAALAPGALPGFQFEEVPPTLEEDEAGTGVYRLVAWGGGKRFETRAQALGDWYDLDTVLLFLNALARERGSEARWLNLATDSQIAHVVAGPAPALTHLLDVGLVRSGDSDEARSLGREFEEAVRRQLEQQGTPVTK